MRKIFFSLTLVLMLLTACHDSMTEDTNTFNADVEAGGSTAGTIIQNPSNPSKLESWDFIPDLSDKINYLDVKATTSKHQNVSVDDDSNLDLGKYQTDSVEVFAKTLHAQKVAFEVLGKLDEELISSFAQNDIDAFEEEAKQVSLSNAINLPGDKEKEWDVTYVLDKKDAKRLYFMNEGIVQGTYLYTTDDNGKPIKGAFVFVNYLQLEAIPKNPGLRLYELIYDFTDPKVYKMVVSADAHNKYKKRFYASKTIYQCDPLADSCLADNVEIGTRSPTREFLLSGNFRYSWTNGTEAVCIGAINMLVDPGVLLPSELFNIKNSQIEETGISCSLPLLNYTISETDIPFRFLDTTPHSGTAGDYFLDGSSLDGWNLITMDYIDEELDKYLNHNSSN